MDNYEKLYQYKWLMRIIAITIVALNSILYLRHYNNGLLGAALILACIEAIIIAYYAQDRMKINNVCLWVAAAVIISYKVLFSNGINYQEMGFALELCLMIVNVAFSAFMFVWVLTEISRDKDVSVKRSLYKSLCGGGE